MAGSSLSRYSPVPGISVAPCCVTRNCCGESFEMTSGSLANFCICSSKPADRCLRASMAAARLVSQRTETLAQFFGQDFRLFPGGEVAALVDLVVVDQLGICLFRPALWYWVQL